MPKNNFEEFLDELEELSKKYNMCLTLHLLGGDGGFAVTAPYTAEDMQRIKDDVFLPVRED